ACDGQYEFGKVAKFRLVFLISRCHRVSCSVRDYNGDAFGDQRVCFSNVLSVRCLASTISFG
ncbi:MAG TPA: hypothetical protein VFQ26_07955, partial [Nitrospiraceae bacterium]|nr:hypothetical protein [Nitrospiraceae bacterium]